jgi:uncharacterized protein YbjT (DUF2867 family)
VRVLVLGGTGFVGKAVLHRLAADGHQLTVLSRRPERCRDVMLVPNVTLRAQDKLTDLHLRRHIKGHDAVINLIGILHPSGQDGFQQVHVGMARKVAAACQIEGVHRLLHMSALGVSQDAPSAYLKSKAEAEAIVMGHGLQTTIFRPSVIFGEQDNFINQFRRLMSLTPVMGVVCPQAVLSPVWVEDVADAFAQALNNPETIGRTYELCGGRAYSMMELMQSVAEFSQINVRLIALPDVVSRIMARIMEWTPSPMFTRDNYASLQVPSVCTMTDFSGLHWQPRSLRSYLSQVLAPNRIRDRYMDIRKAAGRNTGERV